MKLKVSETRLFKKDVEVELPYFFHFETYADGFMSITTEAMLLEDRLISIACVQPLGAYKEKSWELEVSFGEPETLIEEYWKAAHASDATLFNNALHKLKEQSEYYLEICEKSSKNC